MSTLSLTINIPSIAFVADKVNVNIVPGVLPITPTGFHSEHDEIVLSTGDLVIPKGNIGTIGYVFAENLDAAINILYGDDGTNYRTLKPKDFAWMPWNVANFHAKSASGTPKLHYAFFEA